MKKKEETVPVITVQSVFRNEDKEKRKEQLKKLLLDVLKEKNNV